MRTRDTSIAIRLSAIVLLSILFEDLFESGRSTKLRDEVISRKVVLNEKKLTTGVKARRGDGTIGDRIGGKAVVDPGFVLARGHVANVHIGVEVKILAKAMIKQIDRVLNDLAHQAAEFRKSDSKAITVALVGINYAELYTSYERTRIWPTDGKERKHPIQEASNAEARVLLHAKPSFDELLILRFRATNQEPYPFEWVDAQRTELEYEAALIRISRAYDQRFQ